MSTAPLRPDIIPVRSESAPRGNLALRLYPEVLRRNALLWLHQKLEKAPHATPIRGFAYSAYGQNATFIDYTIERRSQWAQE